jgi:hypothetical protein
MSLEDFGTSFTEEARSFLWKNAPPVPKMLLLTVAAAAGLSGLSSLELIAATLLRSV